MELNIQGKIEHIEELTPAQFNVLNINSIKHKYDKERSESKAPTFALT